MPLRNPPRRRSPSLRADTSSIVIPLTRLNLWHYVVFVTTVRYQLGLCPKLPNK
ncbi:MAG: hypothetical protein MR421_01210 [Prevotella sp.]|nr:hypothetical protein [Prevotella sp.]